MWADKHFQLYKSWFQDLIYQQCIIGINAFNYDNEWQLRINLLPNKNFCPYNFAADIDVTTA